MITRLLLNGIYLQLEIYLQLVVVILDVATFPLTQVCIYTYINYKLFYKPFTLLSNKTICDIIQYFVTEVE